ncbi:MAG: LysR family transcriptional regulator [Devosia sp.]
MVLDGIDVFVRVVQTGGFSAAARQLGMPATTVSAKIARLEERLGVTLIQRSTRKMHVTPAGEAYYARCVEALQMLRAGEEELEAAHAEPSGVLRITAPSDLAQRLLPPMVERFLARYPKASVELIVTNAPLDLLAEGIDLALRAGPMKDSSLQSRALGRGALGLFASQSYLERRGVPRVAADLASHDLIIHSRFPAGVLAGLAAEAGVVLNKTSRVKADDMQTLRSLAACGLGIAMLPDFPGAGMEADGLVKVLPEFQLAGGPAHFVYPAGKFVPVNVRAFIDLAVDGSAPRS